MSTNGPLALYCRIVIMVEAGAVAQPMAPKSRLKDRDNPIISITIVMKIPAVRDSNRVRITIFFPLAFRDDSLKYFPTPNAINARARSVIKSICSIYCEGTRFRHQGPMMTPAII